MFIRCVVFFFSSRRRHTRCALVTGVQTCALPISNIDPEHMEFYGSEEALHRAFETFVENIPFYGFAVLCIDHPAVQKLIGRVEHRRIVTYGVSAQADYRAENIRLDNGGLAFDGSVTDSSGHNATPPDALQDQQTLA